MDEDAIVMKQYETIMSRDKRTSQSQFLFGHKSRRIGVFWPKNPISKEIVTFPENTVDRPPRAARICAMYRILAGYVFSLSA